MSKKPTVEQIVAAVVASGATAEQGAESARAITALLSTSPDANAYLPEFNNAIQQLWNDTQAADTIYDEFKHSADAATLQAVVYEKIAPVDFEFKTDISDLATDEGTETRKVPKIHSVLKSLNVQQRSKRRRRSSKSTRYKAVKVCPSRMLLKTSAHHTPTSASTNS